MGRDARAAARVVGRLRKGPVRSGSWLRGYGLGLHRVLALKALIAIGPVRGSVVD